MMEAVFKNIKYITPRKICGVCHAVMAIRRHLVHRMAKNLTVFRP